MAQQKYVSWAAKDTREASSLPSDFDARIIAFQFSKEAPDNYSVEGGGNPIFAHVTMLVDEAGDWKDKTEEERTLKQSYSVGGKSGDEMTISEDGFGLIPNDDNITGIRGGCKFDLLKKTLEAEGVSQAITESGDGSKLVGLYGHWRRVDDEKLLGKKREFSGDSKKKESKFPPQTLVLTKLLALPGEKTVSKPGTTAAASTSSTQAASAPAGDLDGQTTGFLMDVLAGAKDNQVQRSQLIGFLSKAAIKQGNRQDIARRGSDEEFLQKLASDGVITYDATAKPQIVKLAA